MSAQAARLTFLGTSDSKGVPRWWCGCPVCQDARRGGLNRRTRPAALLQAGGEALLLDCGPDLHGQLARLGETVQLTAVLISHAHNDHLMGLGDLLDYRTYAGGQLPIFAPAEVLGQVQNRYQYAFEQAAPVLALAEDGLEFCGFRVRAFRVPHGANGYAYAFRFERPGLAWVYMTDAIDVPDEVAGRWPTGLDLLVLGTSFVDERGTQAHAGRSVYDIREALALPWARAAGQVRLTHLSHDVDARTLELPNGFTLAHDGLTLTLG